MTALALLASAPSARADMHERVDVALLLAVDVSLSMDRAEQRAQRDGYADAVAHPAVLDAIARGRLGRIALAYMEWGGPWLQQVGLPWTVIETPADARAAAATLRARPLRTGRGTSITGAIDAGLRLLKDAPPAARRVIDISGDGPNNMGGLVTQARDRAAAAGVEVNGLPLMLGPPDLTFSIPDLDVYYELCVITGPNAFVIPVLDPRRFAGAIRQKLVLEIAGSPWPALPSARPAPLRAQARQMDCSIGEKLYERWRRGMDWN
jgi:hypothetical protein